jgi:AmmeMemoRadiSam system protein B
MPGRVRPAPRVPRNRREPAVAGTFYPAEATALRGMVGRCLEDAAVRWPTAEAVTATPRLGFLVPHAGLPYSGAVAAAAWRLASDPRVVVILGTNHRAGWLDGLGVWGDGPWATPLGTVEVDRPLLDRIAGLGGGFIRASHAHDAEHAIEVQLPFLQAIAPAARIAPVTVSCGIGPDAVAAGCALGGLLAAEIAAGRPTSLVISSDMAHYPSHREAAALTRRLLPPIAAVDAAALAASETAVRADRLRGVACGMCGIEPAVVGLAALRAMGARRGLELASATSADAGGPADSTVGYLAVAFVA